MCACMYPCINVSTLVFLKMFFDSEAYKNLVRGFFYAVVSASHHKAAFRHFLLFASRSEKAAPSCSLIQSQWREIIVFHSVVDGA